MRRVARLVLALAAPMVVPLAACKQEMSQQRRYRNYAPATLWANGTSAQPLPEGVVARGDLWRDAATAAPPPVSAAVLARGQQRFAIFCTPCHGAGGDGDGMIVSRGFPPPPSFHATQQRVASAQDMFDVITRGHGVMYGFAARVEPADRWAIVAYIRALQRSRGPDLAAAGPRP